VIRALALGASLLAVPSPALANDDAGQKKAAVCAACHGPAGNKPTTPETPRLAGQEYEYLVHVLGEYHKGTRVSPIMNAMAKPLTDKDIHDLASYYSRQEGLTTKR
jgi:cytochrome c553